MENETGRDAQIVLRLPIRGGFREARQEIFDPSGRERQTMEIIKRWIGHRSEQMIRVCTPLHATYRKEVIAKLPLFAPVTSCKL